MDYELIFSPRAEQQYNRIPFSLLDCVDQHLELLRAHPVTLRSPSAFPYPPNRQIYEFQCPAPDEVWYFTVLFRYFTDEEHLYVLGIGFGPRG